MSTERQTSVALDLEGTLADIHTPVWNEYSAIEGISKDVDQLDHWDWPHDHMGIEEFINSVSHLWREEPYKILPIGKNLGSVVEELCHHFQVDIVTSRQSDHGCTARWLLQHDINSHEDYVVSPPGESKASLGYDVFIDDKPALAGEIMSGQTLYLIKQPYNKGVRDHPRVVPVDNVEHALTLLKQNQ